MKEEVFGRTDISLLGFFYNKGNFTGSRTDCNPRANNRLFRGEKGVLRNRCWRGKILVILVSSISIMMANGSGSILI